MMETKERERFGEKDWEKNSGHSNGVYGTAPDVFLTADAENYFIREQLRVQGEDLYSLENRLKWDGVLRQIYGLIKQS